MTDGLLDHRRETDNFTFASEMLAVCGGDGTVRRTHIRRLVRLLNPQLLPSGDIGIMPTFNSNSITNNLNLFPVSDTVSMALMATGCVAHYYGHQYLLPFADQIVSILINKQQEDGSFGANTVSTALAVQALQMKGLGVDVNQTLAAAVEWLVSAQMEDGSFDSDLLSTTEALLALSPMGGRAHVHLSRCRNQAQDQEAVGIKRDANITVQTSIWVGQPVQQRHSLNLKVPVNSTIYEALQQAQADGLLR